MRCDEIMKREVESLREEDSVQKAAQRMRDMNVGFLPVCDPAGRALGTLTLTDRDIAIRVCAENRPADATRVGAVMTKEIVACRPTDDVRQAQQLMGKHRKSRVMVTDEDDALVGVISLSDIAEREAPRQVARTLREVSSREVQRTRRKTA